MSTVPISVTAFLFGLKVACSHPIQDWATPSQFSHQRLSSRCINGGLYYDMVPTTTKVMRKHGIKRLFVLAHPDIRFRINQMLKEVSSPSCLACTLSMRGCMVGRLCVSRMALPDTTEWAFVCPCMALLSGCRGSGLPRARYSCHAGVVRVHPQPSQGLAATLCGASNRPARRRFCRDAQQLGYADCGSGKGSGAKNHLGRA